MWTHPACGSIQPMDLSIRNLSNCELGPKEFEVAKIRVEEDVLVKHEG